MLPLGCSQITHLSIRETVPSARLNGVNWTSLFWDRMKKFWRNVQKITWLELKKRSRDIKHSKHMLKKSCSSKYHVKEPGTRNVFSCGNSAKTWLKHISYFCEFCCAVWGGWKHHLAPISEPMRKLPRFAAKQNQRLQHFKPLCAKNRWGSSL